MYEHPHDPTLRRTTAWRSHAATARARFRSFRRTRPFWGCLALSLGAYFIISPVLSTLSAMVSMGTAAVSGWVLGGIMLAAAGISLVMPAQRHFPALVGIIVSVASLVLSNLGGYVIGMALGIVGSGMIFAWTPDADPARAGRRGVRRRRRGRSPATAAGSAVVEDTA